MKFTDLLPDSEAEKNAEQVISSLRHKKKLKPEQQANLDKAHGLINRIENTRKAVVMAGLLTVSGAFGVAMFRSGHDVNGAHEQAQSAQPTESARQPAPRFTTVEATNEVIKSAEAGMFNLERALQEKMQKQKVGKILKEGMMEAFILARINRDNPNKNATKVRHNNAGKAGTYKNTDINFFSYEEDTAHGFEAAYQPLTRTVLIPKSFNPANLLDQLVLHHELRHVMQDTAVRERLDSKEKYDEYYRLYSGAKKSFIIEEATAYAYEIEALNLLLDGDLKKCVLAGSPIDYALWLKMLGARSDQKALLDLVVTLAVGYYRSASSIDVGFKAEYTNLIARNYQARGYETYESFNFRNSRKYRL